MNKMNVAKKNNENIHSDIEIIKLSHNTIMRDKKNAVCDSHIGCNSENCLTVVCERVQEVFNTLNK